MHPEVFPAEFVQHLLGHEHAGEGYIHLTGHVSPESSQGRTRLYTDAHLSAWIEVRDEDISHALPPPQDHPDWPTRIWVRRSAEVLYGTSPSVIERYLIDLVDIEARRPPKSHSNRCVYHDWNDRI